MSIWDIAIPVIGSVASGIIGSRGASQAADTASDAERYAADLQFQAANDVMDFQRNIFGYQTAQDAYNRQQAERALGLNIGQYGDQYGLTQRTFDIMGNQLGYGNNLRQNAMSNLQQFANLGLGSLSGLSAMTGGSGAGITGPTPYNVQAPGAIAPLGPSQLNYQPQDTEELFRSILANPTFQLPEDEDDEEGSANNLSDADLAASLADWYLGGSGEAGGQPGGQAGQSGSPSQSGPSSFNPDFAMSMGITPNPNVDRNTAIATAFGLSTPLGLAALSMEDDELNDLLSSWFGYDMPNMFTGMNRDMVGLGDLEGSAGGMGGFIGSPAGGPSSGAGLGGFGGSPAGEAGGYGGGGLGADPGPGMGGGLL